MADDLEHEEIIQGIGERVSHDGGGRETLGECRIATEEQGLRGIPQTFDLTTDRLEEERNEV